MKGDKLTMPHKFNYKGKCKLDNEERRKILPPEKILAEFGLGEKDVMADIGCGIGYFTLSASKIVGNGGRVFAMDIVPQMIQEVKVKIEENNISNVETVLTEENDLKLESGKVTFAFMCAMLHEVENKEKFLNEVKRIMVSNGRIAVVEWKKSSDKMGPPVEDRLEEADLTKKLDELGFSDILSIDMGRDFYGITSQKSS
jgi:ubiquinone/menaquinone biosynthesis C-methylase UbiE